MEVYGLRTEGISLLTTVGLLPLASFSIAGGGFGPGAEAQWRPTLDGPSRSPAGEGLAHQAVSQGGSPWRGGKACVLGDRGCAGMESRLGPSNCTHWEVTSSLGCTEQDGVGLAGRY